MQRRQIEEDREIKHAMAKYTLTTYIIGNKTR